jgi:hydrogenase large subunit
MAAVLALDSAFGATPPAAARVLRNLVHGACFLESHLLHFYLLCLPDYIRGPEMAPWLPVWEPGRQVPAELETRLRGHYLQAIGMRRKAHELGAIFGGKLPHTPSYIAGGFTAVPTPATKQQFAALLAQVREFIIGTYIPDTEALASCFDEYLHHGRGPGNLLAYGAYELTDDGSTRLFRAGRVIDGGAVQPFDEAIIREEVASSWYEPDPALHPSAGRTRPLYPKAGAYSWLKAPRYQAEPYECGPLARMWVNGDYTTGISVMDRHLARAQEALLLADAMAGWLDELPVGSLVYDPVTIPDLSPVTTGLTEAPRGALGHWLRIDNRHIAHYQVITPTCWNVSPRDQAGRRGPLEQALIGLPIENADQPIEALRVIHSIDPCLDCATHVIHGDGRDGVTWRAGGPS